MKLKLFIIKSLGLLLMFSSCSSYKLLLKNQSHSVSVKHETEKITAHILVETNKKIRPNINRYYYSFKQGEVYKNKGGINGTPLQGAYREEYLDGSLKMLGDFQSGLKEGVWKEWYSNGELKSVYHYSNGRQVKRFFHYDKSGKIIRKGRFFRGKKIGKEKILTSDDSWEVKKYTLFGKEKNKTKKNKVKEIQDSEPSVEQ